MTGRKPDNKNEGINHVHDYDVRIGHYVSVLTKIKLRNYRNILEYHKQLSLNGMSKATQVKYLEKLIILSKWIGKDFEKATKADIVKLIEKRITRNDGYANSTRSVYRGVIKRFYQWLRKMEGAEYPPEVSWIKCTLDKGIRHRNPEDMLDEEDIMKMIKVTTNPRDRAFISILAESGCRIGELLTLQMKNINFDNHGSFFLVDGKTGTRRVRVVNSTPFLHQWINLHPEKENPDAPLWVVIGTNREVARKTDEDKKKYTLDWSFNLKYHAARKVLISAAKKAGITKPINPHNFRHSRATTLGASGMNQPIISEVMGWRQGSKMPAVYIHLSGKQTDDALLTSVYGLKVEERKERRPKMFPIKCISCGEVNQHDAKRCRKCNTIIGVITKEDIEQNNAIVQMSKVISNLIDTNGNIKREIINNLKAEILEEINYKN